MKTIKLQIKDGHQEKVLIESGYKKHHKFGHGWIKRVNKDRRFHIYQLEDEIEIHVDITIKGKHKIFEYDKCLRSEKKRIKNIYEFIFLDYHKNKPLSMVISVGQIAKNVSYLQKMISFRNRKILSKIDNSHLI